MTSPPPRAWRAACPNCGAPVDFRSAASASAVCSFCRSTLVRDGEALRRIGRSAELFDDHTPLQLGSAGRLQGEAFTLVGRLQLGSDSGPWNEWHALFDNGRSGWLSEDNGRYVFAFDAPAPADAPDLATLQPGQRCLADGRAWSVASVVSARVLAAEGELIQPPRADAAFVVADLRNDADEVGTLEANPGGAPRWSIGRPAALAELQLQNLREAGAKTLQAAGLACPSCGAPLSVTLASTQSVVCGQCKAVVDLSAGPGAALAHYAQQNPHEPQIPLGRVGRLAIGGAGVLPWQVVGFSERCELAAAAGDDQSVWREYLLYHPIEGFAFLVDTDEGWSAVRTCTGTPVPAGAAMTWAGRRYEKQWEYDSQVLYVLGEFYWKVERLQTCHHADYRSADGRTLAMERTASEVTWSAGEALDFAAISTAFELPQDAGSGRPVGGGMPAAAVASAVAGTLSWQVGILVLVILVVMLSMCSHDECQAELDRFGKTSLEYRDCQRRAGSGARVGSGVGGAWGGFSSGGGGHK